MEAGQVRFTSAREVRGRTRLSSFLSVVGRFGSVVGATASAGVKGTANNPGQVLRAVVASTGWWLGARILRLFGP